MKIILFVVFSLFIIVQKGWELPTCNFTTTLQALPPRLFAQITIDGSNQHVLVTRFFHNKVGVFLQEASHCYLDGLDPNFIFKSVGPIGIISWLTFVYRISIDKKIHFIFAFLSILILPFFNFPPSIVAYSHKIFAIIGLIFLLVTKNLTWSEIINNHLLLNSRVRKKIEEIKNK